MPLKVLGANNEVVSELAKFTRGLGYDLVPIDGGEGGQGDFGIATETLVDAASTTDQSPVGLDNPLQVNFGPQVITPEVEVDAAGNIQFNVVDDWNLTFRFQFGRSNFVGNAIMFVRGLVNGVQATQNPPVINLDDGGYDIPIELQVSFRSAVNDVVTIEIYRDSSGVDEGRLRSRSSTIGWGDSASARVFVQRDTVVTEPNPAAAAFQI